MYGYDVEGNNGGTENMVNKENIEARLSNLTNALVANADMTPERAARSALDLMGIRRGIHVGSSRFDELLKAAAADVEAK